MVAAVNSVNADVRLDAVAMPEIGQYLIPSWLFTFTLL